MNKKKLPTVSVGIPAYNEEYHIIKLLMMILDQNQKNFLLEKIIVMCDGGTDKTPKLVEQFSKKHKKINCINDGKNKGKSQRLNELYAMNTSDILITFDADTILGNNSVLEHMVDSFTNKTVGLVGGHDMPIKPKKFFEKIACTAIDLWYETRKNINHGNTVHNHHGCISAVSKAFAKKIYIPKGITSDDEYLYFAAIKEGFKFQYAKDALLYYQAPRTLNDYLLQSSRFIDTKQAIIKRLGKWVENYYAIPKSYKTRAIKTMLKKDPFFTVLAIGLQMLLRVVHPFYAKTYQKGKWTRIESTKG